MSHCSIHTPRHFIVKEARGLGNKRPFQFPEGRPFNHFVVKSASSQSLTRVMVRCFSNNGITESLSGL